MSNLFLPEINLAAPPEFNHSFGNYWSLKNPTFQKAVFLDFLTPDECQEVIKLGYSFSLTQSSTGMNGYTGFNEVRKSYNSWIPPCELSNWYFYKLDAIIKHVNEMNFEYDLHSTEHVQFTVYDEKYSGMYGIHIDPLAHSSTADSHRKLSYSVQLSDPCDYEGGDLLLYQDGNNPIHVPKKQGLIAFFPSYTLHEVKPVTKGTRITGVSWIHGPRFK